jgi:hypothetical protein
MARAVSAITAIHAFTLSILLLYQTLPYFRLLHEIRNSAHYNQGGKHSVQKLSENSIKMEKSLKAYPFIKKYLPIFL